MRTPFYRKYPFVRQDPVIERVRSIIEELGLLDRLDVVSRLTGVSVLTLHSWLEGRTISPRHCSVAAVINGLGWENAPRKARDIDIEEEEVAAEEWRDRLNRRLNKVVEEEVRRAQEE